MWGVGGSEFQKTCCSKLGAKEPRSYLFSCNSFGHLSRLRKDHGCRPSWRLLVHRGPLADLRGSKFGASGAACGLARLKVWAVIPASTIFAMIAVVLGFYLGLTGGRIVLVVFAVLMLLQVAYLIGAVLSDAPTRRQVSHRLPVERELLWTAQMAIADELRVYFAPPLDDVPTTTAHQVGVAGMISCWRLPSISSVVDESGPLIQPPDPQGE
jgi:hypothetical protein